MSYQHKQDSLTNKYPAISDLLVKAQKRMPHVAWEYLSSGTGDDYLLQRNKTDFHKISFLPRFCKGALEVETSTQLLGKTYDAPFGIAPIGLSGLMWPKVEIHLAGSANRLRIPYSLSTLATETPESVGPAVGDMGWFQLYPSADIAITASVLERAKQSGFHTLLLTVDIPIASRRERTRRAGLTMPPKITPRLMWQGMKHPSWSYHTLRRGLPRLRTIETYTNNPDMKLVSGFVNNRFGDINWDYCKKIKELWKGDVIIKGILHPKDAELAIEAGLDGIGVSNHGGRQFNAAPSAISVLPSIVETVDKRVPIIFDSGIRSGLDVMKALYLGADFVLAGRPFIAGVAALGKYGGDHVAHILLDGYKNNMMQLGVTTIDELRSADAIMGDG